MADNLLSVAFLHPTSSERFAAEFEPSVTGQLAIDELVAASFLARPEAADTYALKLKRTDATLPLSSPLGSLGICTGDVIAISQSGKAGALPGPGRRVSRAIFDDRVILGLGPTPHLGPVHAFAAIEDCKRGLRLAKTDRLAGKARVYSAELRFEIVTGPGSRARGTTVILDLTNAQYPFAEPTVTFLQPRPFSPHVGPAGILCVGPWWRQTRGNGLAADLLIHTMKVANAEPSVMSGLNEYDGEALLYWQTELGGKAIHANLVYPDLPVEITHGVAARTPQFRAALARAPATPSSQQLFRRSGS